MPLSWRILLLTMLVCVAGAAEGGRILLLNSYHRSDWTDAVQRGVEAALARRPGHDLAVDYLDTKRAQSPEYFAQMAVVHRLRYAGEHFLAVIAVDDHAFRYALDHQADLFAGMPLAFCGVNEFAPQLTAGRLAAGVSERGDISATLDLALRLRPQTREVLLMCDRTQAGLANRRDFEAAMAHDHPGIAVVALDDGDLAGMSRRLAGSGPEAVAFFISFWKASDGRAILPHELESAFRASAIPVFGRSEWMVGKGLTGGLCVSGEGHGQAAGAIALQLIDGTAAAGIPTVDCPNAWLFDYQELVRHHLDRSLLPVSARLVAQPPPGIRVDPMLVAAAVVALATSVIAAITLARSARRRGLRAGELREARDRLAAVLDGVNDAVLMQCPETGRILDANRRACELFGYPLAELRRISIGELSVFEEGFTQEAALARIHAAAHGPQVFAWRSLARDGRRFWSEVSLNLAEVRGEPRLVVVVRDVDDLRRIQVERDRLFAASLDLMCVADLAGRFRQVNPAWTTTLGWSQEELLAKPWLDFVHPDDRAATVSIAAVLAEGSPVRAFENRYRHRDGSWRRLSWNVQPLPGEGLLFAVVRDVSALHQAEADRRETQTRFDSVFASSPMGIHLYRLEDDGRLLLENANAAATRLTGIPASQVVGKTIEQAFPSLVGSEVPERYRAAAARGESWQRTEFIYQDRQLAGAFDIFAFQISAGRMAVMFFEVGERIRDRAELAKREADLAAILEAIGDAVLAVDCSGRISRINPVAEILVGLKNAAAQGRPLAEVLRLIDPVTRAPLQDPLQPDLQGGLPVRSLCLDHGGGERLVTERIAPIQDGAGGTVGSVIVLRDVTEEAALHERLAHAERLDAIGRLAGGVAHDFNNMLTGVTGAVEIIRKRLGGDVELVHWADLALESTSRAADLTRQLLAFSRKHAVRSEMVDIDHAVSRVVAMLGRTIDRRISLVHRPLAVPARVRGDPAQLESALLNLGINARDAMPEGGQLCYDVDVVEAAPRPGLASTSCIRIRVSDTGVGISAQVLPRIFEPFFTTKSLGRGTGLGLAAVYGTAESHGGTISVTSEPGTGSVFTLVLPVEIGVSPASATLEAAAPPAAGRRVLLADDEPSLRELISAQVESLGWSCVVTEDGAGALRQLAATPDGFDVVLLDLVMPVLGGEETFTRMRLLRPHLPIVVMSGYDPNAGGAERLVGQGAVFLQKPFNRAALATALDRALATRTG